MAQGIEANWQSLLMSAVHYKQVQRCQIVEYAFEATTRTPQGAAKQMDLCCDSKDLAIRHGITMNTQSAIDGEAGLVT